MALGRRQRTRRKMNPAAIDTMVVDYLVQAMSAGYNPVADHDLTLAKERVAAFRLFLWDSLMILPTVLKQIEATGDASRRQKLENLVIIHLLEAQVPVEAVLGIETRAKALAKYHSDINDCRIIAEAEYAQAEVLLSFDHRLIRRLCKYTHIPLGTPSEYWDRLAIPRGTPPKWTPVSRNPLSREKWWLW